MSEQDFYQVLELSYDASPDEVRSAYERLRQLFETDAVASYTLFGEDESSNIRHRLDQAFAVLSDRDKRGEYDAEIGNDESAQETDSEPSLSHTATFDAHSEMTVSVAGSTPSEAGPVPESAPVSVMHEAAPVSVMHEAAPVSVMPEAEPLSAEAEVSAPVPAVAELPVVGTAVKQPAVLLPKPEADDKAGLADNHEDGQYSGGVLQRLRENKSLSIQDIAKKTKISLTHLRALEGNAYDKLPARVYVRGFVAQYARCLGLHPDRTADSYLQFYDRYFQTKT